MCERGKGQLKSSKFVLGQTLASSRSSLTSAITLVSGILVLSDFFFRFSTTLFKAILYLDGSSSVFWSCQSSFRIFWDPSNAVSIDFVAWDRILSFEFVQFHP